MIKCELVLASKNELTGDIIYTFKQTFPRIILAEVNTHTIAAKNAASSRAIPTLRQLKNILKEPFVPISVGQYASGMQAGKEIAGFRRWLLEQLWSKSRIFMVFIAWLCHLLGAPKQFSNRLVEPWMWVEQLWTSTDVENETLLRNHWMAEPHYHELARQKAEIIERVKRHFAGDRDPGLLRFTQTLKPGEWHLPYVSLSELQDQMENARYSLRIGSEGVFVWNQDRSDWDQIPHLKNVYDVAKAVSAARCAWVSYYMPGDTSKKMSNIVAALRTYEKLAGSNPKHLSPLMHVATPLPLSVRVGSHCGWLMFRKELEGEAGDDRVVPSITPTMAKRLLLLVSNDHPHDSLIDHLTAEFRKELQLQPEFKEKPLV